MKAWPRAVWQEIAAAWRQCATYHQGTRWLFNFTPPVAKTPVSVGCHNSSYAGGADVLVKGCKEGGGCVGRRTGGGRMVLLACLCARECCTVAVYCAQSTVWPCVHAKQSSASVYHSSKNRTPKRTYNQDWRLLAAGDREQRHGATRNEPGKNISTDMDISVVSHAQVYIADAKCS